MRSFPASTISRHAGVVREVAVVVLTATRIEVGLRSDNLPSLAERLGLRVDVASGTGPDGAAPILPVWSRRRLRAVSLVMGRWPFGGTCLRRALVAGQRLRALDPVLRIGIRRSVGALDAHAWLEIGGVSLDPMASDFSPLGSERTSTT